MSDTAARGWRCSALVAIAGLLLVATAGCDAGDAGDAGENGDGQAVPGTPSATVTASAESMPPGVRLSFIQQRFDEGTRRAQVRVTNGTSRVLQVRKVGVEWAGFPGHRQRVDYPVPGGLVVDLRYRLPRANCDRAAGTAPMRAIAVTPRRTFRQPMPADGRRFLTRLWQTACAEELIARAVRLGYDLPSRTAAGQGSGTTAVLHARLTLHRTSPRSAGQSDQQITITQAQGSVLFDLTIPRPRGLESQQRDGLVAIDVTPGRCDEHARSQSTTTFAWRLWVGLGQDEPRSVLVSPTPRQRAQLLLFLDRACGPLTAH